GAGGGAAGRVGARRPGGARARPPPAALAARPGERRRLSEASAIRSHGGDFVPRARRGRERGLTLAADLVLLHLCVELRATDAEEAGGLGAVAAGLRQTALDEAPLDAGHRFAERPGVL